MGSVQNISLTLITLLCIIVISVLAVENWQTQVLLTVPGLIQSSVSLGLIILASSLLGSLGTFVKLWDLNQQSRLEIKQSELRKEKAEVKAETTTDQVRALESKIQTLEKALEQALSATSPRKNR